jgi:hypothetical protein
LACIFQRFDYNECNLEPTRDEYNFHAGVSILESDSLASTKLSSAAQHHALRCLEHRCPLEPHTDLAECGGCDGDSTTREQRDSECGDFTLEWGVWNCAAIRNGQQSFETSFAAFWEWWGEAACGNGE